MKRGSERSLLDLVWLLISLHMRGYRPVRGYTCVNGDDPYKGAIYVAVACDR